MKQIICGHIGMRKLKIVRLIWDRLLSASCIGCLWIMLSCHTYKFDTHSSVVSDLYTCYANDSLKASLLFAYDLSFKKQQLSTTHFHPGDAQKLARLGISPLKAIPLFSSYSTTHKGLHTIVLARPKSLAIKQYKKQTLGDSLIYYTHFTETKQYQARELLIPMSNFCWSVVEYISRPKKKNMKLPLANEKTNLQIETESLLSNNGQVFIQTNWERILRPTPVCELKNPFSVADQLFNSSEGGNYLAGNLLERDAHNYVSLADRGVYYQALATYHAFAHQSDEVRQDWLHLKPINENQDISIVTGSPAKLEILRQAATHSVTMINEAHHRPEHQYWLGTLLSDFYQLGYRYLALEALEPDRREVDAIEKHKFATFSSGFYVRDPILSNVLREAVKLGFRLVAYEDTTENREAGQARNLYEQTLLKDSTARVLVWAGYNHIAKKSVAGQYWMAHYFHQLSGIDPYTIDQTETMMKTGRVGFEDVYIVPSNPSHLQANLTVFNGLTLDLCNSCFSRTVSKRLAINIPIDSLSQGDHTIAIYKADELSSHLKVIPIWVQVLLKGQHLATASLCVGSYVLYCKDSSGLIVWSKEIMISEN